MCDVCCCASHCSLGEHDVSSAGEFSCRTQQSVFSGLLDRSWMTQQLYEEVVIPERRFEDSFLGLLCATDTDMSY